MATTKKTETKIENKNENKSESGLKALHGIVRDQRKTAVETKLQLKLGRIKNTSLIHKQKKDVARTLTKLNASRIIASLKK